MIRSRKLKKTFMELYIEVSINDEIRKLENKEKFRIESAFYYLEQLKIDQLGLANYLFLIFPKLVPKKFRTFNFSYPVRTFIFI